jgi:hypothetical protein
MASTTTTPRATRATAPTRSRPASFSALAPRSSPRPACPSRRRTLARPLRSAPSTSPSLATRQTRSARTTTSVAWPCTTTCCTTPRVAAATASTPCTSSILAYTLQGRLKLGTPYTVKGYPAGTNSVTKLPWAPATKAPHQERPAPVREPAASARGAGTGRPSALVSARAACSCDASAATCTREL